MAIFTMELEIGGVLGLSRKEVNDITKDSFYLVTKRWRQRYLPLHFGTRATQRYGYARRKGAQRARADAKRNRHGGSYSARKYRAVGHTRPLEYSGEGKRQALSQENIYATRTKGVARLPRKFNWRNPKSQINMADEIRAVRPEELRDLSRFQADYIRKQLRESGAKRATVKARLLPVD